MTMGRSKTGIASRTIEQVNYKDLDQFGMVAITASRHQLH